MEAMAGGSNILSAIAEVNDSFKGNPPGSAGMNQGGMPGQGNSAMGAMEMQRTKGGEGVYDYLRGTPGMEDMGMHAPPPDAGLKDFLQPSQPPQMQPSGEMQLANEVIGATPVDDGPLGNQRMQQTVNNANAAIGLGTTVNGMFQGNPPSSAGIAGRPFQMPNSVLGLQSMFRR